MRDNPSSEALCYMYRNPDSLSGILNDLYRYRFFGWWGRK